MMNLFIIIFYHILLSEFLTTRVFEQQDIVSTIKVLLMHHSRVFYANLRPTQKLKKKNNFEKFFLSEVLKVTKITFFYHILYDMLF